MRLLLCLCFFTAANAVSNNTTDYDNKDQLREYLTDISDWILTTGVGDNLLHNHSISSCNDSIFINGNLARVLLATHKIGPPNQKYLNEGLKWCDTFVSLQVPITTSTGESAGLWDTGYNQVYIADTGTAIAALGLCHSMQPDAAKRAKYEDAMEKFKLFVTKGCKIPPSIGSAKTAGVCPPTGQGWVIAAGKDAGALGDGWYKDKLNSEPYTISTATTGSCGFVEYDAVRTAAGKASDPELASIAIGAVNWLVQSRSPDGRIPYTISPPTLNDHAVYQPITYSAESFIDVDLRYGTRKHGNGTVQDVLKPLRTTCDWLVQNQSKDGSWGNFNKNYNNNNNNNKANSIEISSASASASASASDGGWRSSFSADGDAQRSPRALSLLQWYYEKVEPVDSIKTAMDKYIAFLLVESNSKAFGVNELALPTGFVGLAVADFIQPWVTFSPVK